MTPKDVKALIPVQVQAFKCPVCHKLHLDYEKSRQCVKVCGAAAYRKDLANRKDAIRVTNMRMVREAATSLPDAIERLIAYCKTLGIKLQFTEYPDRLDDVRNSHGSPVGFPRHSGWDGDAKNDKIPETYPGFYGSWKGSIRGRCPMKSCYNGSREIDLRCLFDHVVEGFYSGTGNPSKDFSIEGYMFLYDFPKMCTQGGLFSVFKGKGAYPLMDNLRAIELAHSFSPKLLEAIKKPRGPRHPKPLTVGWIHNNFEYQS